MNRKKYKQQFKKLQKECRETAFRKNEDYALEEDALLNFRRHGVEGILTRIWDKYVRIEHLLKKEASVKDESIEDTLLDLSNYALLALMLYKEKN